MKFFALLTFVASTAFAGEVILFDEPTANLQPFNSTSAIFQINDDNQGYIKFSASEEVSTMRCTLVGGGYMGRGGLYDRGHFGGFPGPGYGYGSSLGYGSGYGVGFPHQQCFPETISHTVLKEKLTVEGLMLEGNKLIYRGAEGAVECATMGRSRILRVPTINLSGKCDVVAERVRVDGVSRLQVIFKTK